MVPANETEAMEESVERLFERYERFFNTSLGGKDLDMDDLSSLYTSEFIAASPLGVMTGKNNEQFKEAMRQGYARYRDMGTKEIRLRDLRLSPIDEQHCVVHAAWTATYAREDQRAVTIDFDVHYLVQRLDAEAKVFGWVSGDEQALLKEHGII